MKNWYKIAQEIAPEYMLEKGMLYDEEGEEVFTFKELIKFNVPLFKTPQEANTFLENLEQETGRSFGRVPEKNYLKDLRYKDTRKEKQEAFEEYMDERNEKLKQGIL